MRSSSLARPVPVMSVLLMPALLMLGLLILGGCIPRQRAPRPSPVATLQTPAAHSACLADLRRMGVVFEPLPDRTFPNGCSAVQAVKLVAFGTPVTNLGAMRCPLARAFVLWVRDVVQPGGERWYGQRVRKLETFGTFACRPVNNVPGARLSEHGRANAVDVSAFVLDDGTRVTVKDGWNGVDERARGFLRALHDAACPRFSVVLGPDANAYHHDHFHFDMGPGPYCR